MLHSGEAIWQEIDQDPGGRRGDREEGDDDDGEEGGDTPDHVSNTLFGLILTGHQLCEVSCDGDEEKVIVLLSAQDAQSFINFQNMCVGEHSSSKCRRFIKKVKKCEAPSNSAAHPDVRHRDDVIRG